MAVLYIRNSSGEFEGVQSLNGKTAYQAAKEGGYTGTESEFNAKLAQEIPTALPNPQPITLNGQRYDGSEAVTLTTGDLGAATEEEANQLKKDIAAITPDDAVVDGKPWTSKKTVDSLCMPIEATGNPVQVYPVEGYPLGVKVSWEPTQAGEGDPSPDNVRPITGRDSVKVNRAGKNLLDFSSFSNYANWRMDIATEGDTPTNNGNRGYILPVKPAKTYTISFEFLGDSFPMYVYIVKSINGVSKLYKYMTTEKIENKVVSFTPEDNEIWYMRMGNTLDNNTFNAQIENITNIQLELGGAVTPYEPYTGSTTDIALPETVYGGTLDVETGVVTVNRVKYTVNPDMIINFYPEKSAWAFDAPHKASGDYLKFDGVCNRFAKVSTGYVANHFFAQFPTESVNYVRLVFTLDGINNKDAAKAYFTENKTEVVYRIAEPFTVQLTPQQIAALSGVNTLCTDAGTLTVTGREDPRHTIITLTDRIAALESAAAGV